MAKNRLSLSLSLRFVTRHRRVNRFDRLLPRIVDEEREQVEIKQRDKKTRPFFGGGGDKSNGEEQNHPHLGGLYSETAGGVVQ